MPVKYKKVRDYSLPEREYLKVRLYSEGCQAVALSLSDRTIVELDVHKADPRIIEIGPKLRDHDDPEITGALFRYGEGFGVVLVDSVKTWSSLDQSEPTIYQITNPSIPDKTIWGKIKQPGIPVRAAYRPEDNSIAVVFNEAQDRWMTSHVGRLWLQGSNAEYHPRPVPLTIEGRSGDDPRFGPTSDPADNLPKIHDIAHINGETILATHGPHWTAKMDAAGGKPPVMMVGELTGPTHIGRVIYEVPTGKITVQFLSNTAIGWLEDSPKSKAGLYFYDLDSGATEKLSFASSRFENRLNHSVDGWMRFDRLGKFVWIASDGAITVFEIE